MERRFIRYINNHNKHSSLSAKERVNRKNIEGNSRSNNPQSLFSRDKAEVFLWKTQHPERFVRVASTGGRKGLKNRKRAHAANNIWNQRKGKGGVINNGEGEN